MQKGMGNELKIYKKFVRNLSNAKFKRLVGVKRSTFETMEAELKPLWKLKQIR